MVPRWSFPLVVRQPEGTAAGQREVLSEVYCINQMAWHLNTLPGSIPSLKDVIIRQIRLVPTKCGAGRKRGMPIVH